MAEKNFKHSRHHDIVLFDGVCNLCNFAVNFIIDRDPTARFVFASQQSPVGQSLLKEHGIPTQRMDSLVLIRGTNVFTKSSAALEIARYLRGLWQLFYIFKLLPYPIRDFIYNLAARYRYKLFGKSESCRYPTQELKARFLNN
jgi:predicted DCC family thiol-disulfide oxidoreductase YuxK